MLESVVVFNRGHSTPTTRPRCTAPPMPLRSLGAHTADGSEQSSGQRLGRLDIPYRHSSVSKAAVGVLTRPFSPRAWRPPAFGRIGGRVPGADARRVSAYRDAPGAESRAAWSARGAGCDTDGAGSAHRLKPVALGKDGSGRSERVARPADPCASGGGCQPPPGGPGARHARCMNPTLA